LESLFLLKSFKKKIEGKAKSCPSLEKPIFIPLYSFSPLGAALTQKL
jgi:hypothetical protein